MQDGTPARINGHRYWEATELDPVVAGAFPVVYGNFKRGCRIARRRGLRVLRDELTEHPVIVIKMSERWGFRVWLGEALVKLEIAA
jgi:HK97 family phage major capsid protein